MQLVAQLEERQNDMWETVYELHRPLIDFGLIPLYLLAAAGGIYSVKKVTMHIKKAERMDGKAIRNIILICCYIGFIALTVIIGDGMDEVYDKIEAKNYDRVIEGDAYTDQHKTFVYWIEIDGEEYYMSAPSLPSIPSESYMRLYLCDLHYDDGDGNVGVQTEIARVDVYNDDQTKYSSVSSGDMWGAIMCPYEDINQKRNIVELIIALAIVQTIIDTVIRCLKKFEERFDKQMFIYGMTAGFIIWISTYWYVALVLSVAEICVIRKIYSDISIKSERALERKQIESEDAVKSVNNIGRKKYAGLGVGFIFAVIYILMVGGYKFFC